MRHSLIAQIRSFVQAQRPPLSAQPSSGTRQCRPTALQKCALLTKIPKIYSACSIITTIRMAIFFIFVRDEIPYFCKQSCCRPSGRQQADLVVRGRWKLAYERALSSKYAQAAQAKMTAHFRLISKRTRACAFLIYNYARTRTRAFLCFITYYTLYPSKTLKNAHFLNALFSALYKESAFFYAFFCKNIWSYQKKAVPLHSLLRNK